MAVRPAKCRLQLCLKGCQAAGWQAPSLCQFEQCLGSCGPGKLTEKGKFPKVLRGGCKRSFGPSEQRSPKSHLHHPKLLLHRCKMGLHRCKRLCALSTFGKLSLLGQSSENPCAHKIERSLLHRCNPIWHRCKISFGWCKRLFGDLCSLGPKDLLHPPLSSGSEKGVFWKRGLFRKIHFLEILENLEILEILEKRQTLENKGESDHFLEILENLEILEILEIPPVKRPLW